jgi:hypothetical protein
VDSSNIKSIPDNKDSSLPSAFRIKTLYIQESPGQQEVMCLVTAYFDASYNHPKGKTVNDPRVHMVAAYLARQDDWRKLRKEWRRVLDAIKCPWRAAYEVGVITVL